MGERSTQSLANSWMEPTWTPPKTCICMKCRWFVDDDHIKAEWVTFDHGKPMATAKFDLRRMKKE